VEGWEERADLVGGVVCWVEGPGKWATVFLPFGWGIIIVGKTGKMGKLIRKRGGTGDNNFAGICTEGMILVRYARQKELRYGRVYRRADLNNNYYYYYIKFCA